MSIIVIIICHLANVKILSKILDKMLFFFNYIIKERPK